MQRPGCPPFNLINHEPLSDQPRQVGGDDDDDGDGDGDDDGDDDGGSGGGGGDGGSGGGGGGDLYIIGAVCHKSDYFAQRNFLEPSGTI